VVWYFQLADTVSQSTDEQLGSHLPLPVVYWQQQIDKTKTLTLKQAYHSALTHAQLAYRHDPVTLSLSPESLQHWWSWAEWMVSKFQRTSFPVEGRNGYLS